jgi:hypothetical protein
MFFSITNDYYCYWTCSLEKPFYFFEVVGIELGVSQMLGKCSATELPHQPLGPGRVMLAYNSNYLGSKDKTIEVWGQHKQMISYLEDKKTEL